MSAKPSEIKFSNLEIAATFIFSVVLFMVVFIAYEPSPDDRTHVNKPLPSAELIRLQRINEMARLDRIEAERKELLQEKAARAAILNWLIAGTELSSGQRGHTALDEWRPTRIRTGRPKSVYVRGYRRKDGVYVRPHYRSRPRRRR